MEEQEGYYEEFLARRPLRITDGQWTMQSNISASGSNSVIQVSNNSTDDVGVAALLDVEENDGNDEGLRVADAPAATARTLAAQVGDCRISEIA